MAEYVCEVVTEHELCGDVHHYVRKDRVTRCLDCKHAEACPLVGTKKLICDLHDQMLVDPDGFCSWGKPREEG